MATEVTCKKVILKNKSGEYLLPYADNYTKEETDTALAAKANVTDVYTKEEINSKLSSVYKYKGSVANFAALPAESLEVGDVYNTEDDGSNYAWTGTQWDNLGTSVDLSAYYTKTETDALIPDVPTKTSQLTNDSNFITSTAVDTKISNALVDTSLPWGKLTGNLADQTDLKNALDQKQNSLGEGGDGITISNIGNSSVIEVDNTVVRSQTITNMVALTQAEYDALETKDPQTIYYVIE